MKYSVRAILRDDKPVKVNGTHSIHYLVGYDGYQVKLPSGYEVHSKYWNEEDGRVKKATVTYAGELNSSLGKRMDEFRSFMLQQHILGHPVTKEEIKAFFGRKESTECFHAFAQAQVEGWKHTKRKGTLDNYRYTLNVLKRFRSTLRFSHLDLSFIEAFDQYLRETRGNTASGLFNRHKSLKSLINAGIKKGLVRDNPYRLFRFKNPPSRLDFLTLEEVASLENTSLLPEEGGLVRARDFFLLSCYTGIRFSDLRALKPTNLRDGSLTFTMQKTNKAIAVPLIEKATGLLVKYASSSASLDRLLPMHTNRRTNAYLKEVFLRAGITRPVSFHLARHTFASLHVDLGTHMVLIKDLMGHSSIEQTEIYSKGSRDSIVRSMAAFNLHVQSPGNRPLLAGEQLEGPRPALG
jgi:integrase